MSRRRWSTAETYLKPFALRMTPLNGRRKSSVQRLPMLSSSHLIDITISVRDLAFIDIPPRISCVLWENSTENESEWRKVGISKPTLTRKRSVHFEDKFRYNYVFEKAQLIRVDICSCHDSLVASCSDDVLGSCIFKVDELIGSFGLQLRKPMFETATIAASLSTTVRSMESFGCVQIAGQIPEKEQPIIVQLHGKGLDRKDFLWDETAVFFRVFRLEEGSEEDSLVLLYESEAIKNHSHPQWAEFHLEAQDAADNRNRLLEIWVMYRDVDGKEGYIGKFLTTYAKMKYGPGPDNVYQVINEQKKAQKKNYEHSGKMELVKFTDVAFCSFLDYIASGTQLHFDLAVDFSLSGKEDMEFGEFDTNFQLGLRAIGGILRDYTPNRLFPAYGLGAKIPPTFHESHEFHLNFTMDPVCRGLDGVLEAFRKAQAIVTPTKEAKFAPIVLNATRGSKKSGFRGLHYHVLTVFTTSPPVDIKELHTAIMAAADAPLSIIFICIGNSDFSPLQKICRKKEGKRECTEVVIVSELLEGSDLVSENKARLAAQSLHLIPAQMVSYMHNNNIAAKPPIQVCRSPLFHSSSLIPDKPTQFPFDVSPDTPSPPRSDRRGSDSHFLDVDMALRNTLTVRVPERCHSVLQTSREQYQRRLREKGLSRVSFPPSKSTSSQMRFPRVELSTLESSGGSGHDNM